MTLRYLRHLGLFVLVSAILVGIFLAREVTREFRSVKSASADNVDWTLMQIEVEFLEYQRALEAVDPGVDGALDVLRRRFDILYSRIGIIRDGAVFRDFRGVPANSVLLAQLMSFLDGSAAVIDLPDAQLIPALPQLTELTRNIRDPVRQVVVNGVVFFAARADDNRAAIAGLLLRLAVLSVVFLCVLALMARYSQVINRRARQRQAELVDAYARLNTVMEASLDAIIVADAQCHVLSFNRAAKRMLLWDEGQVLGQVLGDVLFPEEYRSAGGRDFDVCHGYAPEGILGQGPVKIEGMRSDGSRFPLEMAFERARSGADTLLIGFLRDISAQVAAETELVVARDRALAGEKAKGEFLTVMTHEIRTPLNGILGNIVLLQDTEMTSAQQRCVANMSISGQLLMHHVDTVLDIARFEAGQLPISEEPVQLDRLLDDLINSQAGRADKNGDTLRWYWVGTAQNWIRTDPRRVQQIILNLVDNAIKYTRNGQITIEVEAVAPEAADPGLEFRVIDTGVGISEGNLGRIFEDFQTNDTSFQRVAGGTGLGLGIVRRLTLALGGEFGVESEPGEGSVFWIRLPVMAVSPPVPVAAQPGAAPHAVAFHVLVVEDNDINKIVAEEMLRNLGQRVTTVSNGQEAVHAAAAGHFDLIFMDVAMPVMDGLEAARQIRAGNGPSARTPIIALSANVLPEAKERFKAAGMTDFLGKPFRKDELQALLHLYARKPGQTAPRPARTAPDSPPGTDPRLPLQARYADELRDFAVWLDISPQDPADLATRAHRIAGSAAVFGDLALQGQLNRLEEILRRDSSAPEIAAQVQQVRNLLSAAVCRSAPAAAPRAAKGPV